MNPYFISQSFNGFAVCYFCQCVSRKNRRAILCFNRFFGKQFGLRKILNENHSNRKINGNQYSFQHNVCLKLYLPMHEHNNGQNSDINKDILHF